MNFQRTTPMTNQSTVFAQSSTMIMNAKHDALKPIAMAALLVMTAAYTGQLLAQTAADNQSAQAQPTNPTPVPALPTALAPAVAQ